MLLLNVRNILLVVFNNRITIIYNIMQHSHSKSGKNSQNEQDPYSTNRSKSNSRSSRQTNSQKKIREDQLQQQLLPSDDKEEKKMAQSQRSATSKMSKNSKGQDEQAEQPTLATKIKQYLFQKVQTRPRTINFMGECVPINYQNNLVKNTKYNIITFIPLVLFNQFKFFFNLFFLITALSQLIQMLRVGLFITYIGPLIMVLSLTMGKQAYDDYRTYLRDIQANSKVYQVIRKDGKVKLKSKDLKVGDLVILCSGDRVPADMITIYSDNEQGTLFLKTDQLDGETDWKLRKALKFTQALIGSNNDNYQKLLNQKYYCKIKEPIGQIYTFDGVFVSQVNAQNSQGQAKQKLTLENTMWTSTVLTNGQVVGLVIYVGNQTRVAMGASTPRTKVGILDLQINFLSKVLFFIMVGLTVIMLILQNTGWSYIPIQFTRILILLSSIIPISMRVNLDFAKLFYAYQINNDKYIQGTITRNSNCPEELGRIKYILSDKTGTLTQNQMIFKSISIEDSIKFAQQNLPDMKQILQDYENIPENMQSKERYLKQIVTALALCHNVTPVYNDEEKQQNQGQENQKLKQQEDTFEPMIKKQKQGGSQVKNGKIKDFQASSPDEITFVKIVQSFGIELQHRTQTQISIKLPSGKIIKYEILYTFPFSSETKRMGILLRNQQTRKITFYLKGADSIMKTFVSNKQKKGFIQEECRDLSMTGLRTLVITKKQIKEEHFEKWAQQYQEAYNQLQVDKKQIQKLMNQLENGVQFLGITGIQDKLQKKLKPTIESLKSAGIKIWMITGDKIQTAECISRSCGLQKMTEQNIKIEQTDNLSDWKNKWEAVKANPSRVLIIDGKTLTYVLETADNQDLIKDFYVTAMKMPAVICCRCSPQQKRILTQGVKKNRGKKQSVLGIGDGGNDVGMIQAADIGVGIVGKQGKQAALAADFSILQFKNIKCLLLWHGRLSYKRSSLLASFIIHRGFIVSVIQIIFSCVFFYVSIPVFNSVLQLGYATIFTFWPVFSLILDTDIDKKRALKYPALYASLQSSDLLSIRTFISWIWKATFQGSIIMLLCLVSFGEEKSYLQIQTLCFTILILTQYCMTLSQIHRLHILTLVCSGLSLLCYSACLFLLREYIHVSILTMGDFAMICLITAVSWGPLVVYKILHRKFYPSDYQKVMLNVKRSLIAKKILKSSIEQIQFEGGRSSIIH